MKEQESLSAGSVSAEARLPYLRPEIDVQHVELEGAITAASVGGQSGTNVTDWTPGDQTNVNNPGGNTGDVSFP